MVRFFSLAFCLSLILAAAVPAQEAISLGQRESKQSNSRNPVVVLKNGNTFRPVTATISGDRIKLRFADSTTKTFSKSAVVFEESSGITDATAPKKNMKKGDLSTYAASITLQKSAAESSGTITIVGDPGIPRTMGAENKAVQESEADDTLLDLRQSAAELRSAWDRYQSFNTQVDARCRDYRYGWSGGRRYVISAIETAECQDGVRQLRARLPPLKTDYDKLTRQSRRDGVEPGKLREVLSSYGLLNFPTLLSSEDRHLESLLE